MKNTLKDKEVQSLIKKNKSINSPMIYCFFSLKNKNLKFAFSSSKVFRIKATKNFIKRQLRSIVYKSSDWPKDLNVIFIAKKNYNDFSYEEINKNITIIKEKIKKTTK